MSLYKGPLHLTDQQTSEYTVLNSSNVQVMLHCKQQIQFLAQRMHINVNHRNKEEFEIAGSTYLRYIPCLKFG